MATMAVTAAVAMETKAGTRVVAMETMVTATKVSYKILFTSLISIPCVAPFPQKEGREELICIRVVIRIYLVYPYHTFILLYELCILMHHPLS